MRRTTVFALVAGLTLTVLATPAVADELCIGCPAPTTTTTAPPPQEAGDPVQTLVGYLNQERQANGLPTFALRQDVSDIASGWSRHQAETETLSHNNEYFSESTRARLHAWALGENVAAAPSLREAHEALMASAPHRQNILDPRFVVVGIGAVPRNGRWWITEDFVQPAAAAAATPAPAPAPPAPPPSPQPSAVLSGSAGVRPASTASTSAPAVERSRSTGAGKNQTMRLEPSKPLRDTRRSAPGGTGSVPSAPFGLVGLAAVAIWAAGSAALTTLVRRRAATTRRARRLGVGGFGTGLPAAG